MDLYTINYIKNNPVVYRFLREYPSWYKELNRSSEPLKIIEELAKKRYQLTTEDRMKKFSQGINLISNFIDVLK